MVTFSKKAQTAGYYFGNPAPAVWAFLEKVTMSGGEDRFQ
jgi:hypothetical protein